MKKLMQHPAGYHISLVVLATIVTLLLWFVRDWFFAGSFETFVSARSFAFIFLLIFISIEAALYVIKKKNIRKHPVRYHIFLFILAVIVSSLLWLSGDWFFAGSISTFGPAHSFGFICLAIFIAIVAALNAINATSVASDTQRPFLNVSDCSIEWQQGAINQPKSANVIRIDIQNTGVFPSNDVSLTLATIKDNNTQQVCSYTLEGGVPSIIFPGCDCHLKFQKTDGEKNLEIQPDSNDQLLIKVTTTYLNQLSGKKCKTIRGYKTQHPYSNTVNYPEDDYWD